MWQLENIKATNIASFKELEFEPTQGVTTLVFGQNLDNLENQPSNGSGKSALIEAFSIVITGDPLRKVKLIDEIINDDANDMSVCATFWNTESKDKFTVTRNFARKEPQSITCSINGDAVVKSSVLEYNRFILDMIGITKEELYSYFLLTEQRYQSFFAAKDSEKKALINKFSNADIVDQAIEEVVKDKEPISSSLDNHRLMVSKAEGAVGVIEEQIANAKNNAEQALQTKAEKKAALREKIASLRQHIRENNEQADKYKEDMDNCDALMGEIEKLEDESADEPLAETYEKLKEILGKLCPQFNFTDWTQKSASIQQSIDEEDSFIKLQTEKLEPLTKRIENGRQCVNDKLDAVTKSEEAYSIYLTEFKDKMDELVKQDSATDEIIRNIKQRIAESEKEIAQIQTQLHGAVTCPNCQHRFVVGVSIDVTKAEERLVELESLVKSMKDKKSNSELAYDKTDEQRKEARKRKSEEEAKVSDLKAELNKYKSGLASLEAEVEGINAHVKASESRIAGYRSQIASLYKQMFNQSIDAGEERIQSLKRSIRNCNESVAAAEGTINTYEEQIEALDNYNASLSIEQLEKDLAAKKVELYAAQGMVTNDEDALNVLVKQESAFVRFKTTLANSKITALSQMLNGILEQLGSDLRVRIDGYTILKSGKVRDKISVSIIRDGVDFGSYFKLSKGERTRIDVACIVAMSKLVNTNCDSDKGLDLLVMDEILSGVDEMGLVGIYEALNKMQITTMVVSHNPVAQSYPHTLTVTKRNGTSTINQFNDKQQA